MAARAEEKRHKPQARRRTRPASRQSQAAARAEGRPRPKARRSAAASQAAESRKGPEAPNDEDQAAEGRAKGPEGQVAGPDAKAAIRAARPKSRPRPAADPGPTPSAEVLPVARPLAKPSLDRSRRLLSEDERLEPALVSGREPSTERTARSGHDELKAELGGTTKPVRSSPPAMSTRKWQDAYAVGDEAPGGDNPTPDQDRVDDIGKRARHSVPGRSGTAGRRRSRRARQASLGARPGLVRRLAARDKK